MLLHVSAPSDAMAMAAMGGGNKISLSQRRANTRRNAFLSEIGMEVSADEPLAIKLDAFGFEHPDLEGSSEKFFQKFAGRCIGSFWPALAWKFTTPIFTNCSSL